ncbi:putative MFS family arabinose efflux permease [Micromonospora sp. Llam0]|uniref:MFS transporter n=1 Tax=Micromonospora sp. Llam0 TaxID=2485143 RepID=UPI000F46E353|nr:MFS transporter [Micromonospora sp. Llam0]ROO63084.1 putative MFS family arabinose efflux permease [Micromonospora sp. Llam0]
MSTSASVGFTLSPDRVSGGIWRRDFRWLWAAFGASELGTAVGYSALSIIAVLLLDASDLRVSMLTVLSGVVAAVVALPLGPWIEYRSKRPVMIGTDLLRFLAVASVPAAAYLGWLTYWHLCLVAVVHTVATLAFNCASVANLKALVPREHRAEANSRFEATLWTANAIGPPAGGLLISWVGVPAAMVVDAISYLASAAGIRRLTAPERPPPRRAAEHHWSADVLAGWRYILRHRGLTALFFNAMVFGGCIMAASPLLTVFMLRDRGFAPWQYGLVLGFSALAGVVGSLLARPLIDRLGHRTVLLAAGVGRCLWLGLIPFAPATLGGLALIAVSEFMLLLFVGLFNPTFATYRMNATTDEYMSRVVMAWSITSKTVQPVFIAAAGLLAAATTARTALIVTAALLLTATALLPWHDDDARKDMRYVPSQDGPAAPDPPARRWPRRPSTRSATNARR